MTANDFIARVRRQQGGVLLDTNVLLLHLMDQTEPSAVAEWKRTCQFTELHVGYLRACVQCARRMVTTPHIVTEVTNLSQSIPVGLRARYWELLRSFVEGARERWVRARRAARDDEFATLGLADVAQALLPERARPLVITVDAGVYSCLSGRSLPVINLNHFAFPVDPDMT